MTTPAELRQWTAEDVAWIRSSMDALTANLGQEEAERVLADAEAHLVRMDEWVARGAPAG